MELAVLLHNVRSAHNVGSIFRTADAAGVSHVFLTGYTPRPLDRFGRAQKNIAKTALGAEVSTKWEYRKDPMFLIRALKRDGWRIVGVEQDVRSSSYKNLRANRKTAFLFGNEVRGLSPALRNVCDVLIEIPVRGAMVRQAHHPRSTKRGKESLNVSVAVGIILFSVR